MTKKILCVVGARPNFMKIAPIMRAFSNKGSGISASLLHTGQHYDADMKVSFFEQLGIPEPDVDLGVGSGTHAQQTAEIMRLFEPELDRLCPDAVLVVGDVNSTIACSLVSVKKGVPVIHVEAGLRSYDRGMPEEINRILTDQISDLLFLTEKSAAFNLEREGINAARMRFVGNVMIDTLYHNKAKAIPPAETLKKHDVGSIVGANSDYAIVTLHRPSNVDDPIVLKRLLTTLAEIGNRLPVIFPLHPRTRARIDTQGFWPILEEAHVLVTGPLGYLELLGLMASAKVVLTDSGGLQEETTALGIPCITLRENTERPITETEGTNTVVGSDPEAIGRCLEDILETGGKTGRVPELWDGQAASRIAETIRDWDFSKSP